MKQTTIAVFVLMCATLVNSSPGNGYLSTNRSEWCFPDVNKCFETWNANNLTRLCNPTTAEIDCNVFRDTKTCVDGVRGKCNEAQLGCYYDIEFVGNVSCYRSYQVSVDTMLKPCSSVKVLQSSANCVGLMQELDRTKFDVESVNATSLTEFCKLENQYISSQFDKYQTKYGKEIATVLADVGRIQLSQYGCNAESNPPTTAVLVTTVAGNYTHNHSLKLSAVISTLFITICLYGVM